jgi:hypothetical protein
MAKLSDLANQFHTLRLEKDSLGVTLKEVQKKLDAVERELLEEMGHEGLNRVDLKGKGSFFITTRKFFKVSNRDTFIDFIHEQGDTDLLTVQHQTLQAYAKELCARKNAEGVDDFLLPGVEFTEKTTIKMKKTGSNTDSDDEE